MAEAPVIETGRLVLRPHRPTDLAACAAMWADPAVTRYISARPFTREEVWARLLRYAGHWHWMGYGFWAIEEKATQAFVGELGFAEFEREMDQRLQVPEAGWVLSSAYQGRGFGEEALRAVLNWAEAGLVSKRTVCLIHPDNEPSLRLALKCGYAEAGRTVYKGMPTVVLER